MKLLVKILIPNMFLLFQVRKIHLWHSNHTEKWVLDQTSIFAQVDAFVQRCKDLLEVRFCFDFLQYNFIDYWLINKYVKIFSWKKIVNKSSAKLLSNNYYNLRFLRWRFAKDSLILQDALMEQNNLFQFSLVSKVLT